MIVETALLEIGETEVPANSNKTKYGRWFGLDGVHWCGIFVSYVYAKSGHTLKGVGFSKGFAGCQTAVAYYRKHDKIVTDPQAGDIVFFDWNGDGRHDHTGIFEKWADAGHLFYSIEGNTGIGNDSNGGSVMRRKRSVTQAIFVRP
jgi:hypothetical protein